jgi:hypothetical protein
MADLLVPLGPSSPVRLRGHTLLCLQGFRGEGYSPGFVANMTAIHQALTTDPDRQVEVIASPDAVCGACPHQQSSGCTLNGERSEEEMVAQDREVVRRLGLTAGDRLRWADLLDRIRNSVNGDDLPSICGGCRWLPLGYCREGVNRLRETKDSATIVDANWSERIRQEPSRM